mgnify:CR=1 FL=1
MALQDLAAEVEQDGLRSFTSRTWWAVQLVPQALDEARERARLAEALERLDPTQRAAMVLRVEHGLSYEAIAEELGYSDVANFTRAFRRWTGTTPASFRRSHR